MIDAVAGLAPTGGMMAAACAALGVSRASVQRRRARLAVPPAPSRPRPRPARALSAAQQQAVLDLLHAPRFADQAPAQIYASLLNGGVHHCSVRTMGGFKWSSQHWNELCRDLGDVMIRRRPVLAC